MSNLFVLPRQVPLTSAGGLLPGAKLYFFATGTSTPQDTYEDSALTVANANPVVADANGVFPAIYFDPSLPNYRVTLKTSADVTVYTEDGVPSNQNIGQTFRLKSTAPQLLFEETDASADNGKWALKVNNEEMTLVLLNDAEASSTAIAIIDRSGMSADSLTLDLPVSAPSFSLPGGDVPSMQSGSFTGSLSGFSAAQAITVKYQRIGDMLFLSCDATATATSNATSMQLSGLPSVCQPANVKVGLCSGLRDNGAVVMGGWSLTGDTITFSNGASLGNFTASGSKGVQGGWHIEYPLT